MQDLENNEPNCKGWKMQEQVIFQVAV